MKRFMIPRVAHCESGALPVSDERTYGQAAYDATMPLLNGDLDGETRPWATLPQRLRDAWQAAGDAVAADVMTRHGMTAGDSAPAGAPLALAAEWARRAAVIEAADPREAALLREHAGDLQRALSARPPAADGMTPEALAAEFDRIAAWMATRPNGVTWTGDGLDGTVAGLRDAAKSVREHLAPAWDALAAERDALARRLAEPAGYEELAADRDRDRVLDLNDRLEAENTTIADWLTGARAALGRLADAAGRFADRYGTIEHIAELRAEIAAARAALEAR